MTRTLHSVVQFHWRKYFGNCFNDLQKLFKSLICLRTEDYSEIGFRGFRGFRYAKCSFRVRLHKKSFMKILINK
jgi:hypothetical protein